MGRFLAREALSRQACKVWCLSHSGSQQAFHFGDAASGEGNVLGVVRIMEGAHAQRI